MSDPTLPSTPGFYPAAHANGEQRYWDGTRWMDDVPSPTTASAPQSNTDVSHDMSAPYLPTATPTRSKRKKWPWIVGGVAAAVIIIGAVASGGADSSSTTSKVAAAAKKPDKSTSKVNSAPANVSVPNLVGSTVAQAQSELASQGLSMDAQGADTTQTVSSQVPAAGTSVTPGTLIVVTAAPKSDGSSVEAAAPAGTKFDMQSTNRLDGSKSTYEEWVDSYNDNYVSSNEFEQPDANMKYVVLTVHVQATTAGVTASSVAYDLALSDPSGTVYSSTFVDGLTDMPSATLGAGQAAQGQVAFEVPNDFHGGIASFGDGSVFEKTN